MFCYFYIDARLWMNAQIAKTKDDSLFIQIPGECKTVPNDNLLGNQCLEWTICLHIQTPALKFS